MIQENHNSMRCNQTQTSVAAPAPTATALYFYLSSLMTAFVIGSAILIFIAGDVSAQTPEAATSAEQVAPRYSAEDVKRAFGFMDSDNDGKVSREEAKLFRKVTQYFDEADTNKDGFLSLEEFDKAMNKP
jgi:hypothetical protein